jgi:hypothetical protein
MVPINAFFKLKNNKIIKNSKKKLINLLDEKQ